MHSLETGADGLQNACVESVKPTVGCADATQAGCICVSPSFVKGVAECARAPSCNAADADITSFLSNGFCVGQQLPALPEAAATSASGAATTSAAAVATSSEVAAATSETPAAADTSDAASSSAAPPVTSEAPEATSTDVVDATSTAETAGAVEPTATGSEASASSTDADSSSTASEAAGAAATSDSSDDDSDKKEESSSGMSGAAKAGVGIGVTIGILTLLGIAGFFWKKRQNQHDLPRGNMASMSPPMATRDRSYPLPDQGSIGEKNGYDLELMSHRYEDMLPREEPRHMV
ncbi:hypothetical protein FOQG_06736 [Fusarium oxysporum f. sp. raphani 54005]|uniref:CFEM domain-containing protein n=2 Tax=Fusarium oxysporum TaxID=5507 RepID=X0CA87_FUSOX|nr:hypothetical protein FOVG_06445 [Fusarium oxysporum f. sp. pisi HDV247]EXK91335.1 hypothetical protein FOQG_06736 [Fusarium oxysporum f. sp. raphani 54005]